MIGETLETLLTDVLNIKQKYEEKGNNEGINFNVFEVINLRTQEVRLHSKFLAELLNPNGSHGQREKFLELFVKCCNIEEFEVKGAQVFVEAYIGEVTETTGGRLDIYLTDRKGNAIVIENKIYAKDQENQLLRYHNHLIDCHKSSVGNLLYLNLYGGEPDESSVGELKQGEEYNIISYQYDILEWLKECISYSKEAPLLREGITHYFNLIKSLTGQSINEEMNNSIAKEILSDPKKVESALQISNSIIEVKAQIQFNFWEKLRARFVSAGIKGINYEIDKNRVVQFCSKKNDEIGFFILIKHSKTLKVYFGVELNDPVYFGFFLDKNDEGGISSEKKYKGLVNEVYDIDNRYVNNDWWLGYQYFESEENSNSQLDFRSFNDEIIFKLCDDDFMDAIVDELFTKSLSDMKKMEEKLKDGINSVL